jgi:glycosyltransferase involved in cell wall biosynthesis
MNGVGPSLPELGEQFPKLRNEARAGTASGEPFNVAAADNVSLNPCPRAPAPAASEVKIRKALCLNMIVKNEKANLKRCLAAVAPYISCWIIGDTGSTDGTQEFIRSFFATCNIPGELFSYPFIDFAQARNEALDRAYASVLKFDYLLLLDADMELLVHDPAFLLNLTSAAYYVRQRNGITYRNIRLLRHDVRARYRGVTHEFLSVSSDETSDLNDVSILDYATGSNRTDKYKRDLPLLTQALATESDPMMTARYVFYLANTLRDSGQWEAALHMYLRRASLGNWRQEVFLSLLNAAMLKEATGYPDGDVISTYVGAAAACRSRAEALHGAARFCRTKGLYEQGYAFAVQGLAMARPSDALFPEDWIYDYGLCDELAVCAYWTSRYAQCRDACDRLLSDGTLPVEHHARVLRNRDLAVAKLGESGAFPSSTTNVML